MTTQALEPSAGTLREREFPSRLRRLIASLIDAGLLWVVAILWFHLQQWATYTDTYFRQWPAEVAMPVMIILPFTAAWLEAISGRGLGKLLTGLRVVRADDGEASLPRLLGRSLLKWSPVLIGPLALVICTLRHSDFAEAFASDRLVPLISDLADDLPAKLKPMAWMLEQAARTINIAAVLLVILAIGEVLAYFGRRRSLLDRVTGTRLRSKT